MNRGAFVFAALLLASLSGVRAADTTVPRPAGIPSRAGEDTALFESRIRPILVERCYECHSTDRKQKGNLLLDSREGTLKGGDTAPAVIPGDPEKRTPFQRPALSSSRRTVAKSASGMSSSSNWLQK